MNFSNTHFIPHTTPANIWERLFDSHHLLAAVAECQQLIWIRPRQQMRLVFQRRIGPFTARPLWVDVTLFPQQPYSHTFSFVIWDAGVETAAGEGQLGLAAVDGGVQLTYELAWEATGELATVGDTLLETQTRSSLRHFFATLETAVGTGQAPAPSFTLPQPRTNQLEKIVWGVGAAVAAVVLFFLGRRLGRLWQQKGEGNAFPLG